MRVLNRLDYGENVLPANEDELLSYKAEKKKRQRLKVNGKTQTTIFLDRELYNRFKPLCLEFEGHGKTLEVIAAASNKFIKEYIKKHE